MPAYRQFYPGGDRNIIWPLELMSGESDAFDVGAMV
ncbi:LacI family transcriptional regulator, partial [Rhizobium ruizarguesonis]